MTPQYLLDTGVLNAYLRGRAGAVARVDPWVVRGRAATSVLVYGEIVEFLQGRADGDKREAESREVLRVVHPYQLTYPILRRYASPRRTMRPPGGPGIIGDVDTLIAATALARGCTLVTLDGDFRCPE
ncbi:MAG TPA: type II toxin-antitoxin system VapC family toxin [Ktedonobacterales bacterium]